MKSNISKEDMRVIDDTRTCDDYPMRSSVFKSIETLQLDKGQDHVDQGHYINSNGVGTDWILAMDGHGNNSCINTIRKANMDEIMATENPALELQKILDADKITSPHMKLHSGATFISAKMYDLQDNVGVDISYAGDSIAIVILNGQHIFTTEPHTLNHSKQMMRLIEKGVVSTTEPTVIQGKSFELVNSDTLISKQGEYVNIKTDKDPSGYVAITPSSSVGHNGLYGSLDVDTVKFQFKKTDTVRVVLMSDGVSDVVDVKDKIFIEAKSSKDIVNYAQSRWKQTWNYLTNKDFSTIRLTKFPPNGYDDCCAAIIERKPYVATDQLVEVVALLDD